MKLVASTVCDVKTWKNLTTGSPLFADRHQRVPAFLPCCVCRCGTGGLAAAEMLELKFYFVVPNTLEQLYFLKRIFPKPAVVFMLFAI